MVICFGIQKVKGARKLKQKRTKDNGENKERFEFTRQIFKKTNKRKKNKMVQFGVLAGIFKEKEH